MSADAPDSTQQRVAERTQNDPFDQFSGTDAQGQSIEPYDPGSPADVLQPDEQADYETWKASHEAYEAFKLSDNLPDDVMDKFIPVTVDGETYRVTAREAAQGYQRERDYSNHKRKLADFERQLVSRENGLRNFLADLDRGETFLDAIVALKKFKGFHEAAMIYGRQLDAERNMTPDQRRVYQANRQLNQELKEERRMKQALQYQLQNQPAQQPQNASVDRMMNQLAQIMPKAAALTGFVDGDLARQAVELHMDRLLPDHLRKGGEIDTPFVAMVLRAAMQEVDAAVRASNERRAREQPNARPPTPGVGASPMPNNAGNPGQPGQRTNGIPRAKIGDFGSIVGRR